MPDDKQVIGGAALNSVPQYAVAILSSAQFGEERTFQSLKSNLAQNEHRVNSRIHAESARWARGEACAGAAVGGT